MYPHSKEFLSVAKKNPIPVLPFRDFFTYEELEKFLRRLADSRGDFCRLSSLGASREGREVFLLTITDFKKGDAAPDELAFDRPAFLIHGNIHAGELAGTHAALFTARQLLADAQKSDILKRVVFFIVPRLNPDGAEFVVTKNGHVRSRTDRSELMPNTLYQEDVDGNGLILQMRQEHPDGGVIADPKDPRLLIGRRADSKGPFYRTLPEGRIHEWDGTEQIAIEGRSFDWNRNWAYGWRPEPEQYGAGDFPFSEVEMRHFAEFIHGHRNIFGVLGYHTGPAAVLRPPSTGSAGALDAGDEWMIEDLARIASEKTGFPVYPVVKYHDERGRDINLHGHFHDFGYNHLGLYVYEFELGTIFNSAGISTKELLSAAKEEEQEALVRKVLNWWDAKKTREPLFEKWRPFKHPQLGNVEIGGFVISHQINPTLSDLRKISAGTYQFTLDHAKRHPSVVIEEPEVTCVGGSVFRIRVRVVNRGEFPTNITNKGVSLRRLRPVRVELRPASRVSLLSKDGHCELGHLPGITGGSILEWFLNAPGKGLNLCEISVYGGTGGNSSICLRKDM